MIYQIEKLLKDNADKIGENDKDAGAGGHREPCVRRWPATMCKPSSKRPAT